MLSIRRLGALVGVVAVLVTGCSEDAESPSDAQGSTTAAGATAAPATKAAATKAPPKVALSNAFMGNAWRQSMISAFEAAATKAKADGLISDYKVSNAPGENSATDQIAQLKSLLLEKPDILLINPASPTALSPTIKQACDAGIKVVVFDSGIESDCAFVVTNSFPEWAKTATENVAKGMGGKGNLLISRGVVGSDPEAQYYKAQLETLKAFPEIKVVGEVTGFCSSAKAQEAVLGVLSGLPEIHGVAGCGDGFGIAQAFKTAGRPIPVLAFEPSGRALKYWAENPAGKGSIAIMSDPGQSVAALYTALYQYNGNEIAKETIFPSVLITEDARDKWINVVGDDEIASWQWTKDLVETQIKAQAAKTTAPLPPVPAN